MRTKLRPFEKLKSIFRVRPGRPESAVGAVVYRKTKGDLTILLLQTKRGLWSVPTGVRREEETPAEAVARLVREKAGPVELKIWQPLGQIDFDAKATKRASGQLQLFLAQALSTETEHGALAAKEVAWLPVREALERVAYEEVSGMINLAVAKIRRAQI